MTVSGGAALANHPRTIEEHIEITFPRNRLRAYQPKLRISQEAKEKYLGMYGWQVRSANYEYDVLCYWSEFTHQDANTSYTSHDGDHEPIFLYLNDSGDIVQDRFSAYHWYAGGGYGVPTDDEGHPTYDIIEPWHHHVRVSDTEGTELLGLEKLGTESELRDPDVETEFEKWLAGGLEEELAVGAGGTDPALMLGRSHWWATDIGPISQQALRAMATYFTGAHGAERANPRDITPF